MLVVRPPYCKCCTEPTAHWRLLLLVGGLDIETGNRNLKMSPGSNRFWRLDARPYGAMGLCMCVVAALHLQNMNPLLLVLICFSRLPSSCPHSRLLTLPLTCTASVVCPLPETRVQLSMVTRSVCRLVFSPLFSCDVTFQGRQTFSQTFSILLPVKLNPCFLLCCSSAGLSVRTPSGSIVGSVLTHLFYPL